VALFHAALQAWNVLLPVLPGEEGDTRPYVLAVMLTMLLASLVTVMGWSGGDVRRRAGGRGA